ncbi:hypothetical protein FQN50_007758 [Emmonsiellopsis sp. PD_5]|nr:hypothetical protein FQN50_007758 [Emmonsiellopsis sp. PD_5]
MEAIDTVGHQGELEGYYNRPIYQWPLRQQNAQEASRELEQLRAKLKDKEEAINRVYDHFKVEYKAHSSEPGRRGILLFVLVPRNAGAGWQGCSQAGYASADTGSGSHVYLRGRKLPQEDSSTQAEHQWSGSVALLHEISEQLMVLTDLMMQSWYPPRCWKLRTITEGGRAGTSDGTENPVELIEDTIEDDAEDRAGE